MAGTDSKFQELQKKILFTVIALCVYRVATQVPTPGVDGLALSSFFQGMKGSVFGVFNTFSGGALERFSVLALGVMPYITSSIIFSLLAVSFPTIAEMQKDSTGHKKISQYTRYLTVILCAIQGYSLSIVLESVRTPSGVLVVTDPGYSFRFLTVISLLAGTMFVMWLGEQITERGIGNGVSLLIFAGIVAGIPAGFSDTLNLFKTGELTFLKLIIILAIMISTFWVVIFIEKSFRKVPVHYAKRVVNNRVYGGQTTHLPIKLNVSGVMPPIFASALLGFPATVAQFVPVNSSFRVFFDYVNASFFPGKFLYNIFFVALIFFFASFYASIQFRADDISESLKKNGGFIPGIRPGERTSDFLNGVVSKLTVFGAIYVSIICILPAILFNQVKIPFYFGGTSLLIIIGVSLDTISQLESYMISQRFDQAYKVKGKHNPGQRRF